MSNDLKNLLKQLQNGEIEAIEYGDGKPFGFMSNHRIIFIPTAGGSQFCIKKVTGHMLGSGMYFGLDVDAVVKASEDMVKRYTAPHPNPIIREMIATKGDHSKVKYFVIPKN